MKGWSKERVKYLLRDRYGSVRAFAQHAGVGCDSVRRAFYAPYPKIEAVIASEVGVSPAEIWPDRYAAAVLQNPRMWKRARNVCNVCNCSTAANELHVRDADGV